MRRRPAPDQLSRAELATLVLLANGRQTSELAVELGVTRNTVTVHRRRALRKLDAPSLQDAVMNALRAGIIRPDAIVTGPYRFLPQLAAAQARLNAIHRLANRPDLADDPVAAELRQIIEGPFRIPRTRRSPHAGGLRGGRAGGWSAVPE